MLRLQVGQADIAAYADAEAAKLVESAERVSEERGKEERGEFRCDAECAPRRSHDSPSHPPHLPQIKAEADALAAQRSAESAARCDAAMDSINAAADELAAELAAACLAAAESAADLAAFEAATAAARSEGHFFKSLYPGGESADAETTAAINRTTIDTTPTSRPSSLRVGVWTATSVALAGGAAANLFSTEPAWTADGVAVVLAIVLAVGAVVEGRRVGGK